MKRNSQADLIKQMTDREVLFHVYLTQLIILCLTFLLSLFLFESFFDLLRLFKWDKVEIIKYGLGSAFIVILIDLILVTCLPKKYYDDGGINERVFKNRSIIEIFFIAIIVALAEELLFRGVIQTNFGYAIASILFAVMHIRYLKKPVLLISVLFVSFYIGWMYEITENLTVTVTAHFTIDFILALIIRYKK